MKIAVGAGVGGLMIAVAIVSALGVTPQPAIPSFLRDVASGAADATPARCRTITMPDSGCDAAWQSRRRHFFGEDDKR